MAERPSPGARMLAQRYYVSDEIFEAEQERLFRDRWLFAGHGSELAEHGDFRVIEHAGASCLMLRAENGSLCAFHNVCRHRGSILCSESRGKLPGRVTCPYHSWTWRLDGSLKSAPNMTGAEGFAPEDWPLLSLPVEQWSGLVFVRLGGRDASGHAEDLRTALPGLFTPQLEQYRAEELVVAHEVVYEVASNWKLLFQNYSECYHCPTVHPQLNSISPWREAWNEISEGTVLGGPMRLVEGAESLSTTARRTAPVLGDLAGDDLTFVRYYTIFPNLFLSLHPDFVLAHRLEPLSPHATRIVCQWWYHRDAATSDHFDPSPAVEFWDLTNRQDWTLCERSHRGITTTGYVPGPYAPAESLLPEFDRAYLRLLEG